MEEVDYKYLVVIVVGLFYDPGGYVSPCKLRRFERGYECESSHIGIFLLPLCNQSKTEVMVVGCVLDTGIWRKGKGNEVR